MEIDDKIFLGGMAILLGFMVVLLVSRVIDDNKFVKECEDRGGVAKSLGEHDLSCLSTDMFK